MARKIKDYRELLLQKIELEEMNPDTTEELRALVEHDLGIDVLRIGNPVPLESVFPSMPEMELDRLKATIAMILTDTFGLHKEEVFDLLFASGDRIFWQ